MESPVDLCFAEEGCSSSIVLEKQVFRSKVPESHVQLACSMHYCAFPLNGNELCILNTTDDPDCQVENLVLSEDLVYVQESVRLACKMYINKNNNNVPKNAIHCAVLLYKFFENEWKQCLGDNIVYEPEGVVTTIWG